MTTQQALTALAALAQPTRLAAFRLLVQAGDAGIAAGDISAALNVRQNTMSSNLSLLMQAGLIRNQREGRAIRYFVDMDGMRALLAFLLEDCCGGTPSACRSLLDDLLPAAAVGD